MLLYVAANDTHSSSWVLTSTYVISVGTDVCKDLVLYDTSQHNQFRNLMPLIHEHPILLDIMVANAALHMTNRGMRSSPLFSSDNQTISLSGTLSLQPSKGSEIHLPESHHHALAAKQRALHRLQSTLATTTALDSDVALAVVLLFIEFELIASGRNDWKHHVNGARAMINELYERSKQGSMNEMTPLRRCLISNCLVYVVYRVQCITRSNS